MTDVLPSRAEMPDDEPVAEVTRPPLLPVVMLVVTAATSIVFLASAVTHEAGSTDEISSAAVFAWLFGSLLGLLSFAWFGLLDSVRRSGGNYQEPSWRPRLVAAVLATAGWLAGSAGAFVVAQAVARR